MDSLWSTLLKVLQAAFRTHTRNELIILEERKGIKCPLKKLLVGNGAEIYTWCLWHYHSCCYHSKTKNKTRGQKSKDKSRTWPIGFPNCAMAVFQSQRASLMLSFRWIRNAAQSDSLWQILELTAAKINLCLYWRGLKNCKQTNC